LFRQKRIRVALTLVLLVAVPILVSILHGWLPKDDATKAFVMASMWLGAILFLGTLCVWWACACRVTATIVGLVSAPRLAIGSIPRNWWRVIGCTDCFVPPVLLPGVGASDLVNEVAPLKPLPFWRAQIEDARKEVAYTEHWLVKLFAVMNGMIGVSILALFVSLPSWVYRWSIKGTSLVWAPLAVLVWEAPHTKPEHIAESRVALAASIGAGAILTTAIGAALKSILGTDFGLLKGYEHLAAAAANHKAAAAFFPLKGVPTWQWIALVGAIVVLAGYLYARRLKDRGWTESQKLHVDLAYHAVGFISVTLIFSWIYTAASVADWSRLMPRQ
jgi:hypothetical protein